MSQRFLVLSLSGLLAVVLVPMPVAADGGIEFRDIARFDEVGIKYRRAESPWDALWDQLKQQPTMKFSEVPLVPLKSRGAPGTALFDYDNDGDLDIFVTNGPGRPHSLYQNQLVPTGALTFRDVGGQAGVAADSQNGSGVCFGDIDNDGDHDLYVLGTGEANRLFENQGDGTFLEITNHARVGGGAEYSSGCSMGDVNGDGLLDIVVGNTSLTWDDRRAILEEPFAFSVHNQLFLNQGGNRFADVSETSGIQNLSGFPDYAAGAAGVTWAIAMVDYDQDGDVDIFMADDQGVVPNSLQGGVDRGLIHLMENDGTGYFTDVNVKAGLAKSGSWMGLAFGDLNQDDHLDVFVTNVGDYMVTNLPVPYYLGADASRWFLGQADGTFLDPGVGSLVATPFGWGVTMQDYDNDADTDIIFYGGLDVGPFVDTSNPGAVLQNDGSAIFTYDKSALANSGTDHSRRTVEGVVSGDLNNDGFIDLVSVSNVDMPESFPLIPAAGQWGSVFDATATIFPSFQPVGEGVFKWNGLEPVDGTLSVEISNSDNGNGWVTVDLVGGAGLFSEGRVNRDGIGAVVRFETASGKSVLYPVVGGASYASQNSLTVHLGLGDERRGTLEVLWPGGVRNHLYDVRAGERIVFPEIPCSIKRDSKKHETRDYERCVRRALTELGNARILDRSEQKRFFRSAIRAYATGSSKG